MNHSILSVFSGGGLLDIGFSNQGFQIEEAVEINSNFIKAYNLGTKSFLNSATSRLIFENIIQHTEIAREVDASNVTEQNRLGRTYKGISGLIGGPPCQDFSNGGKHQGHGGEKGKLILSYLEIVRKTRPDFLFFENVSGLRNNKSHQVGFFDFIKSLQRSRYTVVYDVLNALNYGVPQDRARITLVGFRNEIVEKLLKKGFLLKDIDSNSERLFFKWPKKKLANPKNIEWPKIWDFGSEINYYQIRKIPKNHRPLCVGQAFSGINDDTANQKDQFEPYSNKFKTIREGDTYQKSFKRLHRFKYSPTVAYGNNEVHLHPTEKRRLSVREALRLQSVPDSYILPDDVPLTDKFKIISNGVPTKKAELIAKEIRRTMTNYYELK